MHEKNLDIDFRGEPGKFTTGLQERRHRQAKIASCDYFWKSQTGTLKNRSSTRTFSDVK